VGTIRAIIGLLGVFFILGIWLSLTADISSARNASAVQVTQLATEAAFGAIIVIGIVVSVYVLTCAGDGAQQTELLKQTVKLLQQGAMHQGTEALERGEPSPRSSNPVAQPDGWQPLDSARQDAHWLMQPPCEVGSET
jgi:hypothetical protein